MTDMLCGAFEGGSNYWITKLDWTNTDEIEGWGEKSWWEALPLAIAEKKHFEFMIQDLDGDWHECTTQCLWVGVEIMSQKYYRHFVDMIAETDDATTADVYLQCALFGDVVYG